MPAQRAAYNRAASCLHSETADINAESAIDESAALISVSGLSHRYPRAAHAALHDVDFHVPRGSLTGLLGPNGAGKSTLLAILNGVTRLQSGDVRVAGQAPGVRSGPRSVSSLVPQACAFYSDLDARENLAFFAGIHRLSSAQWHERLDECVAIAGLEEVLDRRAGTLSGGLQRRLNLALGLINRPAILYLDEPTVGVDARSRQCIRAAIARLQRAGTTIVYTSHYMEEVEDLCDRLTVIDRGRTLAAGPTASLLEQYGGVATEIRLQRPGDDAVAAALAPWSPVWLDAYTVRLAAADTTAVTALTRELDARSIAIEWLRYGVDRLDDVYPRLLGHPADES